VTPSDSVRKKAGRRSFVLTVACGNTVVVQVDERNTQGARNTERWSGEVGPRNISSRHRLRSECVLSSNVAGDTWCSG